jgi:hypothetical protein
MNEYTCLEVENMSNFSKQMKSFYICKLTGKNGEKKCHSIVYYWRKALQVILFTSMLLSFIFNPSQTEQVHNV